MYFDFEPEENQLNFRLKAKLLKRGTSLDDNETINIDSEVNVNYFTECNCGPSISAKSNRQLELSPEIKFQNFSESRTLQNSTFKYSYLSNSVNGYYFELANLNSPIEDYDLGVYAFGINENEPQLKFKKFIGTPHTLYRQHLDDEWTDYDIEGHFEILEKLDYGLTKLKLNFVASLNGEIVYEFNDIEFAL